MGSNSAVSEKGSIKLSWWAPQVGSKSMPITRAVWRHSCRRYSTVAARMHAMRITSRRTAFSKWERLTG